MLDISPKTVAKWRKRRDSRGYEDRDVGLRSTVLSEAEEAMIFEFRRHTLPPLDDCLYALQPSLPHEWFLTGCLPPIALLLPLQATYHGVPLRSVQIIPAT